MKRLYWCFGILICLCWAGAAWASDLPGMSGSRDATTYDNGQRDGCGPFTEVGSPPYHKDTTLADAGDHCGIRNAPDHIYRLTITQPRSYTFSLCGPQEFTDTYIYLLTGCCSGTEIARDNDGCGTYAGPSLLECITLSPGTYYLVVEAANANSGGPYTLDITICGNACEQTAFEPGTEQLGETSYRFVQTVDSSSPPPYYGGPRWDNSPCAENGGYYGFDFLSWYDNDFDWLHTWPGYDDSSIVSIDSAFVYICAWDVDEPCEIVPVSRQAPCEIDLISIGGGESRPALPHLEGVSQGWSVTRFLVSPSDLSDDSLLPVQLDIDTYSHSCDWAVNVHRSQLVVYYTVNRSPNTPECSGPICVTADSLLCVTPTGPQPPDPDGDGVTYIYDWYRWDSGLSDWVSQPSYADSCLPAGVAQTFESWKCEVVAVDEHRARSEPCSTVFDIVEDCGPNPPCPVMPPMLVEIGQRFCLDFCGRPIKVYWCCPFEGRPVFSPDSGTLPWTVQVPQRADSSNIECPAPGGWWSAEFLAEGSGRVCVSFDRQLAVELLDFSASAGDQSVTLRWSTASERENDHFEIDRRTSGAWSTIAARIPGAGTSSASHSYSYRDALVEAGTTYEYRLISVDFNGTAQVLGTQSIPVVQHDPVMVSEYRLYPNYPNPFNPTTTIAFDLAEAGHVSLRVYDVMGREVAVLVNGNLPAGRHREVFDAQGLPSGVYLYKLTSGSFTDMQKMVLLK